jgi:hypothetical protein
MHAVSLTPDATGACGVIDTGYTGACGIIDTACTIEWPWQPLKGISIKNIYVPELSYNTPKQIYKFKDKKNKRQKKFVHAVSITPHARFLRLKIDHISTNSMQNSKRRLPVNQGPRGYCLILKNRRWKISYTVPLNIVIE